MSREIKFRAWMNYGNHAEMIENIQNHITGSWAFGYLVDNRVDGVDVTVMQFTGLTDKNGDGLLSVYEGDIISVKGEIIGNVHETQQRESDLVIPQLGTKAWEAAYKEAVVRGFDYAK